MIDVVFNVNGQNLKNYLSTYQVDYETEQQSTIVALNGYEYSVKRVRPIVVVSFIPLTDAQATDIYSYLSGQSVTVRFTDPYLSGSSYRTLEMRVVSNLSSVFGLRSVDGNRYYKGGSITLRSRAVI